MKCITVKQPWADCIVPLDEMYPITGGEPPLPKDIENRTWKTDYRGPLLIHAGLTYDFDGPKIGSIADRVKGAIIGVTLLKGVLLGSGSGWYDEGYYGWYLEDYKRFENPIPWKGQLGLYDVPDEVVKEQLGSWQYDWPRRREW